MLTNSSAKSVLESRVWSSTRFRIWRDSRESLARVSHKVTSETFRLRNIQEALFPDVALSELCVCSRGDDFVLPCRLPRVPRLVRIVQVQITVEVVIYGKIGSGLSAEVSVLPRRARS